MKNILIVLICLVLFGCMGHANFEERITRLEQIQEDVMPSTELAGADSRWRDGRTTEGSANVNAITGMSDGDWTTVLEEDADSSALYFYGYDSTACSPAADGTLRIDGSGGGCWYLVPIHVLAIVGEGSDKYINVAQSAEPSNPSDGDCYYDTDVNDWCCWDGSSTWDCVSLD